MGGRERYLLSLLESCETVEALHRAFGERFGAPLSKREYLEFCEQLRRQGLLIDGPASAETFRDEIPHRSALPLRLRGGAANLFFDVLTVLFGWIVHPVWLLVFAPLLLVEVMLVASGWDRALEEVRAARFEMDLAPLFFLSYAQTVLFLNLPLALTMGICCRKYRGRVRSFGVTWGNWVLPTVSFFTDIGDSIVRMSPRGRRTQIALGILVPLVLGGIYAVLWGASSRSHSAHRFWSLMVIPSVIVAIYQCNPFSIYTSAHWALASWLDDWRLHGRAIDETKAWFWSRTSPEPLTARERRWLRAYGVIHYALRFAAGISLLGGAGYVVMRMWGAPGAFVLLVLILWWNRSYFAPLWRFSGMSYAELMALWFARASNKAPVRPPTL